MEWPLKKYNLWLLFGLNFLYRRWHQSPLGPPFVTHKLNKKALCFIDEHGTAGAGPLALGCVLIPARAAGRIDKCFSDRLEASVNEIHAAGLDDRYVAMLLQRFWESVPRDGIVMINQMAAKRDGEPPVLYAQAIVETVKAGLKRFQREVLGRATIGNVDVILDANHHNTHPLFDAELARARASGGRFLGVNRVTCLDSAASRLLQLADLVAYSRKWLMTGEMTVGRLRDRFGIQAL